MKILILHILFTYITISASGQIWSYPPKPYVSADTDSLMAKNKISRVSAWSYEIIDGVETGKKDIKYIKEFDSFGNLTQEIFGNGNSALYDLYNRGYWELKIANGKSYHQKVLFDTLGNVINLTVNDYFISIEYDSLSRPLIAINSTGKQVWFYEGNQLSKYEIYNDTNRIEERIYFYNNSQNSICYTSEYNNSEGVKYPNRDSVIAFMSLENKPFRIVRYEFSNGTIDSLEIIFNQQENSTTIKESSGCTKQTFEKNSIGLTASFINSDCTGKMLRKETYEYEVEN